MLKYKQIWHGIKPTRWLIKFNLIEFMELIQGYKTVLQHVVKFTELARFAPHIVSNDVRKAKKFQRGLRPSIKTRMSALGLKAYSEVVEIAKVVEKECEDYQRIRDQN